MENTALMWSPWSLTGAEPEEVSGGGGWWGGGWEAKVPVPCARQVGTAQ